MLGTRSIDFAKSNVWLSTQAGRDHPAYKSFIYNCEMMLNAKQQAGMSNSSYFTSVHIMFVTLSKSSIEVCTCFHMGCKFEELETPFLEKYMPYFCPRSVANEVLAFEIEAFENRLKSLIERPIHFVILDRLIIVGGYSKKFRQLCVSLAMIGLTDCNMFCNDCLVFALAVIRMAMTRDQQEKHFEGLSKKIPADVDKAEVLSTGNKIRVIITKLI